MNFEESIDWLAHIHSGKCYPKNSEEDINTSLPYFQLSKNGNNKYHFNMYNYKNHSVRINLVKDYLLNNVVSLVNGDLSGYYNIQLEDNYSYLNDNIDYNDVLCFGSMKNDNKNKYVVPLPDCYFLENWNNNFSTVNDTIEWENKRNKIVFVGSTTGNTDPLKNERINTCLWSLYNNRRSICDFYITEIMFMNERRVFQIPYFKYIYKRPLMRLNEQKTYKYLLNIDGHTCRWTPYVYLLNTLHFQTPSKDMLWYYPLLKDKEHFVEVCIDENASNEIIKMFNYYQNNINEAKQIISNANIMGRQLFTKNTCQKYMVALFQNIADNRP
jgi:hypothetical protein